MNEKQARALVKARSGEWCELRLAGCLGRAETMHHRRKQSQGGLWTPSDLLHLCGDGVRGCHGVISNTRTEYYENGWLVKSWDDWRKRPVLLFDGFVLLGDDGHRYDPPHRLGCAVWETNDPCDCGSVEPQQKEAS